MEIEVEQSKLAKALANVSRVAAGAKATLPVLNNVLIRVDGKVVTLTTTNLDMAVVDFLPTSKAENGVITVPARLLAEFVSNLPKGVVTLAAEGDKVTCKSGKYSSVFNGVPADDFPELPGIDEEKAVIYKMGVDEFRHGVEQVIMAASNDMTRPALTGVFFNTFDGSLFLAATDGYRLVEKKFIDKVESEVKAIVPKASLSEVLRAIPDDVEEVEIIFDEAQVRFRMGEIEVTSKLLDASYPDYRNLIPKESEVELVLDKDELNRVTKLAALFARVTDGSIICETSKEKGTFSVRSVANEYGENDSEIETEVLADAKTVINARYLMDILNALDEEKLRFGFSDKVVPVVVRNEKGDDYTHIIMPMNR